MLLFTVVFALLAGWGGSVLKRGVERRAAIDHILGCGGQVTYDYEDRQEGFLPADWPRTHGFFQPIIDAYAKRLARCDLAGVKLHVADSDLGFIAQLPEVQMLWLQGDGISDSGLKPISRLKKLQSLWLCGRKITDIGLEHLQQLESLDSSPMWMAATQPTMNGLANLLKLGSRLRFPVSLYGRTVTDASVPAVRDVADPRKS